MGARKHNAFRRRTRVPVANISPLSLRIPVEKSPTLEGSNQISHWIKLRVNNHWSLR